MLSPLYGSLGPLGAASKRAPVLIEALDVDSTGFSVLAALGTRNVGQWAGAVFTPSKSGLVSKVGFTIYRYANCTAGLQYELWNADQETDLPTDLIGVLGVVPYTETAQVYALALLEVPIESQLPVIAGTKYVLLSRTDATGSPGSGYAHSLALTDTVDYLRSTIYPSGSPSITYDYEAFYFRSFVDGVLDQSISSDGSGFAWPASNGRRAIRFVAGVSGDLTSLAMIVYKYGGSLAAMNMALRADSDGVPGATIQNYGRVPAASMDSTYSLRTVTPVTPSSVVAGTAYWFEFWTDNDDGAGNLAVYAVSRATSKSASSIDGGATWRMQNELMQVYLRSEA